MSSETLNASTTSVVDASYAPVPVPRRRRWGRVLVFGGILAGVALVLASLAGPLGLWQRVFGAAEEAENVFVVGPTTLNVTLAEEGELKPVDSVNVKCAVQGQSVTIQWLVEESSSVKKGDLLVKLASDELKDRVEMEEIELKKITAALEEARQSLEITRSENASTIKKAEIDLAVAELELTRYLKGDYDKSLQSIDIDIQQTEIDLRQKRDELLKSQKLFEKEFISESKLAELKDVIKKLEMTLTLNQLKREILEKYELPKNQMQKESTVERAREELERERQRAGIREQQAQARVDEQEQTLAIRRQRFERLKEQLAHCEIVAPVDGTVQYGEAGSRRRWWSNNRIAVGERVYDGQVLITLPDTNRMMVTTRIHEADRHKVAEGLTCIVQVPAVPGQSFTGTLSKIAQFADSEGSWWNPELKEHAAEVMLAQTDAPLSPGDTAHVEILIEEVINVLAVPVQCVFVRGTKRFVFVQEDGTAEPVEVEVGRASTTMIEVAEGVSSGTRVVMAPDEQMLAKLPMPGAENGIAGLNQ